MASATRDAPDKEGVEFIHEDDGSITAKDIETGIASFGDTKAEALRMLAEAIELHDFGYERVGRERSHPKMRYESPDTDEVRVVSIPLKSEDGIPTGTLHSIADQCGAEDFHAWCEWIDEHR